MSAMAHTPPARVVMRRGPARFGARVPTSRPQRRRRRPLGRRPPPGKGGGFLARDWGAGPTVQLHDLVRAAREARGGARRRAYGGCRALGRPARAAATATSRGSTATCARAPCSTRRRRAGRSARAVHQADGRAGDGGAARIGTVEGVETRALDGGESAARRARGDGRARGRRPRPRPTRSRHDTVGALAEDWLGITVPITGVKSTSIVFRSATSARVEPFALFCGEDDRFGAPRGVPARGGEVYLCGIGGSARLARAAARASSRRARSSPTPRVAAATGVLDEQVAPWRARRDAGVHAPVPARRDVDDGGLPRARRVHERRPPAGASSGRPSGLSMAELIMDARRSADCAVRAGPLHAARRGRARPAAERPLASVVSTGERGRPRIPPTGPPGGASRRSRAASREGLRHSPALLVGQVCAGPGRCAANRGSHRRGPL